MPAGSATSRTPGWHQHRQRPAPGASTPSSGNGHGPTVSAAELLGQVTRAGQRPDRCRASTPATPSRSCPRPATSGRWWIWPSGSPAPSSSPSMRPPPRYQVAVDPAGLRRPTGVRGGCGTRRPWCARPMSGLPAELPVWQLDGNAAGLAQLAAAGSAVTDEELERRRSSRGMAGRGLPGLHLRHHRHGPGLHHHATATSPNWRSTSWRSCPDILKRPDAKR